jgi:hypothetical protein
MEARQRTIGLMCTWYFQYHAPTVWVWTSGEQVGVATAIEEGEHLEWQATRTTVDVDVLGRHIPAEDTPRTPSLVHSVVSAD